MMKQIINENQLTVMSTIARYACAYESIAKPEWWDKAKRQALLHAWDPLQSSDAMLPALDL